MDIQTKHINTILNAKCQVVCMAENLLKKSDYGDDIDCCSRNLFAAISLIKRLECYCFVAPESEDEEDSKCYNCIEDKDLNGMYATLDNLLK